MFKKILVPIDGSTTSLAALDKAIALARAFDAAIDVLYVLDPYPFTGVGEGFAYGLAEYMSTARAQAESALAAAREQCSRAGATATSSLVESHAVWRGILEAAQSGHADLIVMGSHGRSGIEKLVLGSVAQRVVSQAPLPVMVVRSPA